jgi:hypothetical protein
LPATQAPRPASSTQLTAQPPQWFAVWRLLKHCPSQQEKPEGQCREALHVVTQRPVGTSHEDPSGQSASLVQPTQVCVTVSQTNRGPLSASLASEPSDPRLASEPSLVPVEPEPSRAPLASELASRAASLGARESDDASRTAASAPESLTIPASTDGAPTQSALVLHPGSQR